MRLMLSEAKEVLISLQDSIVAWRDEAHGNAINAIRRGDAYTIDVYETEAKAYGHVSSYIDAMLKVDSPKLQETMASIEKQRSARRNHYDCNYGTASKKKEDED